MWISIIAYPGKVTDPLRRPGWIICKLGRIHFPNGDLTMIRVLLCLGLLFASTGLSVAGDEAPATTPEPTTTPEQATRTELGQEAPTFTVEMVGGGSFDLAAHRGKVVLVNFWATWCPPCVAEMPHLRDEVLARFAGDDFAMICISREETNELIAAFAKEHQVAGLPMGGDVDRSIYSQYAEHTIPRNVVVGRDGRILFQSIGFEEPEFEAMISTIAEATGAGAR
jgi:peroxiredoxin